VPTLRAHSRISRGNWPMVSTRACESFVQSMCLVESIEHRFTLRGVYRTASGAKPSTSPVPSGATCARRQRSRRAPPPPCSRQHPCVEIRVELSFEPYSLCNQVCSKTSGCTGSAWSTDSTRSGRIAGCLRRNGVSRKPAPQKPQRASPAAVYQPSPQPWENSMAAAHRSRHRSTRWRPPAATNLLRE